MPGYLKQSTASQSRAIGPFVDATDFKTPETGLTIANTDVKLVVNGGASADKNSGGGTHRANGVYGFTFDATDTAAVGEIEVSIVVAGALPVFDKFFVLEEAVYDALFGASAPGYVTNAPVNVAQFGGSNGAFSGGRPEVNTTHWGGTAVASANVLIDGAITAAKIASDAITSAKVADGFLTAAKFASGAFDAVWSVSARTLTSISGLGIALATKLTKYVQLLARKDAAIATDNATELTEINADGGSGGGAYANTTDAQEAIRDNMGTPQTGDNFARLGAPAGASVSADVAAVKLQTAAIETDTQDVQSRLPAALTGDGNIKADVLKIEGADPTDTINAQADLALADYDPPTRTEATADKVEILDKLQGLVLLGPTVIGSTGNDTTHVHLPGLTYGNDEINGLFLVIFDASTSEYHVREITDWVLSTELATVSTLPFTPQNATDEYWLLSAVASSVIGGDATQAKQDQIIALIGTPANVDLAGDLAAIEAQTDDIGVAGAGLTAIPDSAGTTTLLSRLSATRAGYLDNLSAGAVATAAALATAAGEVTSILGKFTGITLLAQWLGLIAGKQTGNSTARTELRATGAGSGAYDETTDSLEANRDNIGTAGAGLTAADDPTLAAIAALNNLSSAQAQTAAAAALTAYDPPTRTEATSDKDEILTAVADLPTNAELATSQAAADDATLAAIAALNNLSAAQVAAELATYDAPTKAELDAAVAPLATAAALTTVGSNVTAVKAKTDNLPEGFKRNTAYAGFMFKMVDATDHVTGETGLTVTATRSIDGAAFAACANAVSEIGGGVYKIDLAAADLNGTNFVMFRFSASGSDVTEIEVKLVP